MVDSFAYILLRRLIAIDKAAEMPILAVGLLAVPAIICDAEVDALIALIERLTVGAHDAFLRVCRSLIWRGTGSLALARILRTFALRFLATAIATAAATTAATARRSPLIATVANSAGNGLVALVLE